MQHNDTFSHFHWLFFNCFMHMHFRLISFTTRKYARQFRDSSPVCRTCRRTQNCRIAKYGADVVTESAIDGRCWMLRQNCAVRKAAVAKVDRRCCDDWRCRQQDSDHDGSDKVFQTVLPQVVRDGRRLYTMVVEWRRCFQTSISAAEQNIRQRSVCLVVRRDAASFPSLLSGERVSLDEQLTPVCTRHSGCTSVVERILRSCFPFFCVSADDIQRP